MTENVVNLVCLWMFKFISGCFKSLKKSETRLTLNHLVGDLTCNKELVSCSFYHNMLIDLVLICPHWVYVFIYSFITLI